LLDATCGARRTRWRRAIVLRQRRPAPLEPRRGCGGSYGGFDLVGPIALGHQVTDRLGPRELPLIGSPPPAPGRRKMKIDLAVRPSSDDLWQISNPDCGLELGRCEDCGLRARLLEVGHGPARQRPDRFGPLKADCRRQPAEYRTSQPVCSYRARQGPSQAVLTLSVDGFLSAHAGAQGCELDRAGRAYPTPSNRKAGKI
jgi:hypothetical protein